jgi:hypothetical protein
MPIQPKPEAGGGAGDGGADGPPRATDADAKETPESGSHLPQDVLVEALARRRLESPDTAAVPLWLMREPVEVGLHWLELHGKHCRHPPQQCRDTPGPLRRLLKMRPAARRQHMDAVLAALWRYPETSMVASVRSENRSSPALCSSRKGFSQS